MRCSDLKPSALRDVSQANAEMLTAMADKDCVLFLAIKNVCSRVAKLRRRHARAFVVDSRPSCPGAMTKHNCVI